MTWNYRLIRRTHDDGLTSFAIHEVYYNDDGAPNGVTETPSWPQGEDQAEFQADLCNYLATLKYPILDYDNLPSEIEMIRGALQAPDTELEGLLFGGIDNEGVGK